MNKNIPSVLEWISKHTLMIILIVGLIQGLVYVFSIPPWWHYDEPGHFEFAWQIVHFDHWPKYTDVDENMRRQMAASMDHYGWYETSNYRLDLSSSQPVYVGVAPQTTKYALYYLIASLPLRLLWGADFAVQNRAVRLVSLLMFLLTLYVTWGTLGELVPKGHALQWMVPLFMALLPGFVDTMTSINDDVGAVLAFSIFVWASLRLINRGPSPVRLAGLLISVALCYWMKNTAWPAIPISAIVILFSIFTKRWKWLPWSMVGLLALAGLLFVFRWGDAAAWFHASQTQPARLETPHAVMGTHVLRVIASDSQSYIGQWFNPTQTHSLWNKTVTLGAWMWADQPTQASTPILLFNTTRNGILYSPAKTVNLTTSPLFFSTTVLIPNDTERMMLYLQPALQQGASVAYYDGVTLLVGDIATGEPHFADAFASRGTWAGQPFENLVRNASAEAGSFWLNPVISQKLSSGSNFPGSLDVFIASLQDRQGAGWYYYDMLSTQLRTFWGSLARDKAGLLGYSLTYRFLGLISLLSLLGLLAFTWRKRKVLPWAALFILGLDLAGVWGMVMARGGGTLYNPDPLFTWARYAFPAIIPTSLLLCVGWLEGLHLLGRLCRISTNIQHIAFLAFMLGLDIFALVSLAYYFYWHQGQEHLLLLILLPVTIFLFIILLLGGSRASLEDKP